MDESRIFRVFCSYWMLSLLPLMRWLTVTFSSLSPSGINYEVVALMAIKTALKDPYNVLENWDMNSVDPCSWRMVTCSPDGYVTALGLPSQSLSGSLSPGIGNLTNLQSVLLQNNAISGVIPPVFGRLEKLQTLDLSNNRFNGNIPGSLGDLNNLNYLRLNNNSLSGPCPDSLSNIKGLTLLDLSFNNLSGPLPTFSARTFNIVGNPLICGNNSMSNCSSKSLVPISYPPDDLNAQSQRGGARSRRIIIAFTASVGSLLIVVMVVAMILWWHFRYNQQIFFDLNEQYDPELHFGHLKRYSFKELRLATNNFHSINVLGKGGYGIVYKGYLRDGTTVVVKRLKDYNALGGEVQFQTEVEIISLALHRNLLRLYRSCTIEDERLLVYPFMPNGSVELEEMVQVALLCTQSQPAIGKNLDSLAAEETLNGSSFLIIKMIPGMALKLAQAWEVSVQNFLVRIYAYFQLIKFEKFVLDSISNALRNITPGSYLKCGLLDVARQVFDDMPVKDLISWTVMINGLVQNNCFREALKLFNMRSRGKMELNESIYMNVFSICAHLGVIEQGWWVENYLLKKIHGAHNLFDEIPNKKIVNWNKLFDGIESLLCDSSWEKEFISMAKYVIISVDGSMQICGCPKELIRLLKELVDMRRRRKIFDPGGFLSPPDTVPRRSRGLFDGY